MAWLTATPYAVVRAMGSMVEVIQADEDMAAATTAAVGGSTKMDRDQVRRKWRGWERKRRASAAPAKAGPQDIMAMGIGYKVVERG